ncbi:MAG: hypothetical protein FWG32_00535 [Oscillospiraceae bacterium]|nr:hypothetical protein [Oscillospiraceae bacterium]
MIVSSSNDKNPFRYCGEYFDVETENTYLRARYYDAKIARFMQEDTAGAAGDALFYICEVLIGWSIIYMLGLPPAIFLNRSATAPLLFMFY